MKRIGFLIVFTSLFVLIGCQQPSEKVLRYDENKEIIGEEKDEIIGEVSDTIYESIDRSNSNSEEIFLEHLDANGAEVVPPEGRYMISGGQSGRILVYDENDVLMFEAVRDDFQGVGGITIDLNGSHKVYVDGVEFAHIMPVPTQISNELTTGIWEVGTDIEAGTYEVSTEFGFGDIQLFEEGESPRLYEILGGSSDSTIELDLKEGQKVKINGVSALTFEPRT
ncbi:hypothetical protein [Ornithinibacillus halophilus]|uniref:Uncharacterized protein n=1 Tax=Ornithinibacillus halophilus TaxID=930117 RepID=A0A1M5FT30_9BACI|nr:hypothetical protein [Ornithinibacillus halophilus]SHF94626.1 hypothetical protein SAMN05216225_101011 [Ornithinibacillus halophilus]